MAFSMEKNLLTSFVELLVYKTKTFIITTCYLVGSACYYLASKTSWIYSGGMKAGGSYEQRKLTIYCIPTFSNNNYVALSSTKSSLKNDAIS